MTPHRPHKGVIIAAIAILLGFFLPWITSPAISFSPFDLLVGYGGAVFGGLENVLWLIPICCALLLFNEFTPSTPLRGYERLLKVLPAVAWVFFTFVIYNKLSAFGGSATGEFVLKALAHMVGGGFYLSMVGVAWLLLLSFISHPQPAQANYASPVSYDAPTNQADPTHYAAPVNYAAPVVPHPQPIMPMAPPVPVGPTSAQLFSAWLGHNYKPVVATLALLMVSWSVYAFFIKANPQADGKKLAGVYCDCEKEYLTAQQKAKQEYLDAKNPAASIKAQLTVALATIGDNYTKCRQHAKELESEKRSGYIGDETSRAIFEGTMAEQIALWYSAEAENVAKLDQTLLAQGFSRQSIMPVASQLKYPATSPSVADATASVIETGAQQAMNTQEVENDEEIAPIASEVPTAAADETLGDLAVVKSGKAYFYTSADLSQARKAYCVYGDQLALTITTGNAVYATYTAPASGKTVSGWVRKNDLSVQEVISSSAETTADEDAVEIDEEVPQTNN